MNVYALKATGHYGGGMAIVAADSEKKAMVLATGLDRDWQTKFHTPHSVELLPVTYQGKAKVLIWYATGE